MLVLCSALRGQDGEGLTAGGETAGREGGEGGSKRGLASFIARREGGGCRGWNLKGTFSPSCNSVFLFHFIAGLSLIIHLG